MRNLLKITKYTLLLECRTAQFCLLACTMISSYREAAYQLEFNHVVSKRSASCEIPWWGMGVDVR